MEEVTMLLENTREVSSTHAKMENLTKEKPDDQGKVELKILPDHLKYAFLEEDCKKPVIISSAFSQFEEHRLLEVLKANQGAIGWHISDIKGISPTYCMHKIMLEKDYKPIAQPQRRLNLTLKEVVRRRC